MSPERQDLPEWARRGREGDRSWIHKNMNVFWPLAKNLFKKHGRGAFVVDTTWQPDTDSGHPFGYYTKGQLDEEDEDVMRMVREYRPAKEFVIVLLKEDERQSSYRVKVQRRDMRSNGQQH